jgi:hypothetical protein
VAGSSVSEFLEVVRKNLGASDARIMKDGEALPASEAALACELPFGQLLVVSFEAPPVDPNTARRRLEMLVRAFSSTLVGVLEQGGGSPNEGALSRELAVLVERAGALDAFVIDARSPAIWGGTSPQLAEIVEDAPPSDLDNVIRIDGRPNSPTPSELVLRARSLGVRSSEALAADPRAMDLVPRAICEKHRLLPLFEVDSGLLLSMADPTDLDAIHEIALLTGLEIEPSLANERLIRFMLTWNHAGKPRAERPPPADPTEERIAFARTVRERWRRHFAARKAIQLVRRMPELGSLHRGGHLNRTVSEPDFACVAKSFAAIYLLVLVYPGPFDELRASKAISQALPVIESLVLALPPRDPPPSLAGAKAMRRPVGR